MFAQKAPSTDGEVTYRAIMASRVIFHNAGTNYNEKSLIYQ